MFGLISDMLEAYNSLGYTAAYLRSNVKVLMQSFEIPSHASVLSV